MSTLRTDALQTTDSSVTKLVAQLVDSAQLAAAVSATQTVSNNITALKALSWAGRSSASTLGYSAPLDGGHGVYYKDASDVTSVDNGGSVLVATDGTRLKLVMNRIANVRQWGAKGDGTTDDTVAFQNAVAWANSLTNVTIIIPPGLYPVAGNLSITNTGTGPQNDRVKIGVVGAGRASEILHTADQPLFVATGIIYDFSASDFTIRNKRASAVVNNACFYFPDGNANSDFTNVHYLPDTVTNVAGNSFYVCAAGEVNDSVNFDNCYIFVDRMGYQFGAGSSVYIDGGRVASSFPTVTTATGLNLTGGMGGVWITGTDFIGLGTGVNIQQTAASTNREVFLINTCIDSCNTGLNIIDSGSFVSWTGVWAASCTAANINFAPTSDSAILTMSGGTIFNAGANDPGATGLNYGLSVNQFGRLEMDGVSVRNNKNRGISCNAGSKGKPTRISNCAIHDNGTVGLGTSTQLFLAGAVELTNNSIDTPINANVTIDAGSQALMDIHDNKGYKGMALRTGPSIGATGVDVTNSTGQRLSGYFRAGTVTSIWVNGNPVFELAVGGPINGQIVLNPGDTFRVVYTVVPNVQWYFH